MGSWSVRNSRPKSRMQSKAFCGRISRASRKPLEGERLQMALHDNILTPEVRAKGFGTVDMARLDKAIEQIALAYSFKSARPKAQDIFDPTFLPAETERPAN